VEARTWGAVMRSGGRKKRTKSLLCCIRN
jgi:hypothetical protein